MLQAILIFFLSFNNSLEVVFFSQIADALTPPIHIYIESAANIATEFFC